MLRTKSLLIKEIIIIARGLKEKTTENLGLVSRLHLQISLKDLIKTAQGLREDYQIRR